MNSLLFALLFTCFGVILAPAGLLSWSADGGAGDGVVTIIAVFPPRDGGRCECPEINPATDGIIGHRSGFLGDAPCQRMSENLAHPECWQEPEDPCRMLANQGLLSTDGTCPGGACKAEYVVDITYIEPCVGPCSQERCCQSGVIYVSGGPGMPTTGIPSGSTATCSVIESCPCEDKEPRTCNLWMYLECTDIFGFYFLVGKFGYRFTCGRCN